MVGVNVNLVHPDCLLDVFNVNKDVIEAACKHSCGELNIHVLLQECIDNKTQCWTLTKNNEIIGCLFSSVLMYATRRKTLLIVLFAIQPEHRHKDLIELAEERMRVYAKLKGCTALEVSSGRMGWGRKYPNAQRVTRYILEL